MYLCRVAQHGAMNKSQPRAEAGVAPVAAPCELGAAMERFWLSCRRMLPSAWPSGLAAVQLPSCPELFWRAAAVCRGLRALAPGRGRGFNPPGHKPCALHHIMLRSLATRARSLNDRSRLPVHAPSAAPALPPFVAQHFTAPRFKMRARACAPCEMNCGRSAACVASTFSGLDGSVMSSAPAGGHTACSAGSASVPDVRHAVSHEVLTQGTPLARHMAHFLLLGLSDMRCVTQLHCAAVTVSMHLPRAHPQRRSVVYAVACGTCTTHVRAKRNKRGRRGAHSPPRSCMACRMPRRTPSP